MDGTKLHNAREEGHGLPQGEVFHDPGLKPLVQDQKACTQGGKQCVEHKNSPFVEDGYSLHGFERKSNHDAAEALAGKDSCTFPTFMI